ncbi:DUF4212 domain-containing protein [Pontibacillus yanchengensis]|uniref:DUF4212 domain-containing protein n=2 Tax=Pontibacillus yanchengensis TaxID=462910 RepID=A0ACC7VKW9_9BACI|nr:DUF4212 domain-containing protein [Pontibacillus yanchengensis]MYL55427.1 DUF4212 domain-containing protein [Pontibacillus yanchengensis]
MKKIDKKVAENYFRARNTAIIIYLIIWFIVSYGVVLLAEPLSNISFMGMPLHYFMGAQGAIVVFIILLFVNAVVSDKIDQRFGIDDKMNETISAGKHLDH